jgi:hypothetical protein
MVAQHKLEQQEQEGGMETTLLKKKKFNTGFSGK